MSAPDVIIRPMLEDDLPAADRVMRLAFGTARGLPDPLSFGGDAAYVAPRWRASPELAFAAEVDGELIGSSFATHWGSFAFFGPLTVRPDFWDRGVGRRLLAPIMDLFARWGVTLAGLFTDPASPKHLALYRGFGFCPRFLTTLMARPVSPQPPAPTWSRYSRLSDTERAQTDAAALDLCGALYPGLDLTSEIHAIHAHGLGETVLLHDAADLVGFAACHCGPGTEAGGGTCYIKFAAARPGPQVADHFGRLLAACENLAADEGLGGLLAGTNTARQEAYDHMLEAGYRIAGTGVAMHRPNAPGFSSPGLYVMDNWR
jgi:GNAT superfamily N-acetyltransferase